MKAKTTKKKNILQKYAVSFKRRTPKKENKTLQSWRKYLVPLSNKGASNASEQVDEIVYGTK